MLQLRLFPSSRSFGRKGYSRFRFIFGWSVMARTKETEIQAAICDYLSLKGYFFSRTNNSPIFEKSRGVYRALPKYTRKGWPDICLIHAGTFYGIEVKNEDGKLSPEQTLLGAEITKNGGVYIVARSIDDVQRAGL